MEIVQSALNLEVHGLVLDTVLRLLRLLAPWTWARLSASSPLHREEWSLPRLPHWDNVRIHKKCKSPLVSWNCCRNRIHPSFRPLFSRHLYCENFLVFELGSRLGRVRQPSWGDWPQARACPCLSHPALGTSYLQSLNQFPKCGFLLWAFRGLRCRDGTTLDSVVYRLWTDYFSCLSLYSTIC